MELLDPVKLNMYIGAYFLVARKPDGMQYEPDSLTAVHRALER